MGSVNMLASTSGNSLMVMGLVYFLSKPFRAHASDTWKHPFKILNISALYNDTVAIPCRSWCTYHHLRYNTCGASISSKRKNSAYSNKSSINLRLNVQTKVTECSESYRIKWNKSINQSTQNKFYKIWKFQFSCETKSKESTGRIHLILDYISCTHITRNHDHRKNDYLIVLRIGSFVHYYHIPLMVALHKAQWACHIL